MFISTSQHFKRIFQEGDMAIPDRITKEKPILSLTTHDLLAYSEPVFKGLNDRLTFIEIVIVSKSWACFWL